MTLDLSRSLPAGWSLKGLSQPRPDGVNWSRLMPGNSAELTLQLPAPSYLTLRFQSLSAGGGYSLKAVREGHSLLSEDVAPGDRHGAYLNLSLPAGSSTVQFQVTCQSGHSCLPLHLSGLSVQTVAVRDAGAGTQLFSAGLALLLALAFGWLLLGRARPSPPG